MARGDLTLFEEFSNDLGGGKYNFENGGDTIKVAVITTAISSMAAGQATPTWGDFSAAQVSGSGYTAGGDTLASQSYNEASGVATFDANDMTWSQASGGTSGFTSANVAVMVDTTHASSVAFGYIDLGGPVNNNDGDVTISWNASGIFTVTVS